MAVVNLWQGAMTSTGFRVNGKVVGSVVRVLVSTSPQLDLPVYMSPALTPDPVTGVIDHVVTGLFRDTDYYYGLAVDSVIDDRFVGRTRTFPDNGSQASFVFAASSCSGHYNGGVNGGTTFWPPNSGVTDVSNATVFGDLSAWEPLLFIHMGDLHYRDIAENNPAPFRQAYDDVLSAPLQGGFYLDCPIAYVWDDHDYGPNDSNKNSPGRAAAIQVYRERVPSYPLVDAEGIWQTWTVGRVRFVMTDLRAFADPYTDVNGPAKSMTGSAQETWFFETLEQAHEELIFWVCSVPYNTVGEVTNWAAYASQRDRITSWLAARPEIASRMALISGDWHGTGFDDGTHNKWGGFPIFQCGPLDSAPSELGSKKFTHGHSEQRHQYAVFKVDDTGEQITVTALGCRDSSVMFTYAFVRQVVAPETRQIAAVRSKNDLPIYYRPQYHGQPLTPVETHTAL